MLAVTDPHPERPLSLRAIAGSFALILLAGCMPKTFPEDKLPKPEQRPIYGTFNASYDTVWEATLEVLGDMAPLTEIEKDRGYIETNWISGFSDYIYKTFDGTRVPEPVQYRFVVELSTQNGRTQVRVVSTEQVEKDMISANLEFRGRIYEWLDVPSSGAKEREMLQEVLEIIESRTASADYYY